MPNPNRAAILWLGLACLGATAPAMADELADLVKSGRTDKAYNLAMSQAADREGDPAYDLLLAKILMSKRQFGQAGFALERVLVVQPQSEDANITRAELLIEQKNYREAMIILEKTKASNAELRVRSTAAMARIKEETKAAEEETVLPSGFRAYAEFGLGYDDNFNYGTNSQTLQLANGQQIVLGPEFAEKSTTYVKAKIGGSGFKQISPKATLVGYASAQVRNNLNDPLDSTIINAGAGYVRSLETDGFATYVNYSLFESDRSKFRDSQGILFQYYGPGSGGWNNGWQTVWSAGYSVLNYAAASRDADQYQVGYSMARSFESTRHTVSLYFITDNSDAGISSEDRDVISLNYLLEGLNGVAGSKFKPYLNLVYTNVEEGGPRLNFAEAVDTDSFTAGLGLKRQFSTNLSYKGEIGFYESNSNVSIYDVSRAYLDIELHYDFD